MRIAICDDNKHTTGEIDSLLQAIRVKRGYHFDIDVFFDKNALLKAIEQDGFYDILYLDMETGHANGIEAARRIRQENPYCILLFLSGHESAYKELFEVEPLRFIRKPIDPDNFESVFNLAYKRLMNSNERFHFEFNKRFYQVPYKEILYMESRMRTIQIVGTNENYKFYMKMGDLIDKLDQKNHLFIRTHRSFVVNFNHIRCISPTDVEMNNGDKIPISNEYRRFVLQRYSELID